jgi:HEAT repeat protein
MIEAEILEVIEGPSDDGTRLNEIADEFRNGRDASQILVLLDSGNAELVSTGAWILNELHFELYDSDEFIRRLYKLLEHQDPLVRFNALGALYPALDPQEEASQELLSKLRNDPDKGVRMRAEAATARLARRGV